MPRKKRGSSASRLLDHIDGLLEKLREQTPIALETFDAKAVHAARVSTRRLTAVLELMSPVLDKSHRIPLLKGLKRLRKRLGRLRDSDVMLERAAELPDKSEQASAKQWLQERLEKAKRKLHERSLEKSPPRKALRQVEGWDWIRRQIDEADEAIPCLLAESLHLQIDGLAEQAGQLAASRGPSTPTADADSVATRSDERVHRPHQVRIAAKHLRYTLEIAEACGRPLGAPVMRTFKKLQDQLGAWHDWVVLADRTIRGSLDHELMIDANFAESVLKLARRCLRRSARELDRFAATWNDQGSAIVERVRAAFPLSMETPAPASDQTPLPATISTRPTESETGPGPSGSAEPALPGDALSADQPVDGA